MGPRGQKGLQPTRTPASLSYRAEEEGQGRDACPSTPDLCSPPTPGPSWPCLGLAKLRPHCRRLWLLGACLQPGLRAMKATPVWLLTMSLSPPPQGGHVTAGPWLGHPGRQLGAGRSKLDAAARPTLPPGRSLPHPDQGWDTWGPFPKSPSNQTPVQASSTLNGSGIPGGGASKLVLSGDSGLMTALSKGEAGHPTQGQPPSPFVSQAVVGSSPQVLGSWSGWSVGLGGR